MRSIQHILDTAFRQDEGRRFYKFSNADGKTWIMPKKGMGIALNLYQPSSLKGRVLKAVFPFAHRLKWLTRIVHAQPVRMDLSAAFSFLTGRLFGYRDVGFALFCGTPCVHQKITVQLTRGQKILGYAKLSDNPQVISLFIREKQLLDKLHASQVNGIPHGLYCGNLSGDIWVFVQSTVKSRHSRVIHRWGRQHEIFLQNLCSRTMQRIRFENTDFCASLRRLRENALVRQEFDANTVGRAIETVFARYGETTVDFSAYHGDFTPWNMFEQGRELFVFDFEYGQLTYPPMLDKFHFFTQTRIFEKHRSAQQIWDDYCRNYTQEDDFFYLCYLLDMIERYTSRETDGVPSTSVKRTIATWTDLLDRTLKRSERDSIRPV